MKAHSQSEESRTVLVVDDDSRLLRGIARLIRSAGVKALTFDRPAHLLASEVPKTNVCLLLDVHLPELTGVQLYEMLSIVEVHAPRNKLTRKPDAGNPQVRFEEEEGHEQPAWYAALRHARGSSDTRFAAT